MNNTALVEEYRPLVTQLARYMKRRMPKAVREDLEQAGMAGLIESASRYQAENEASFRTFVGHRIRGAMLDSLRAGNWTPRSVTRAARDIAQAIRAIEAKEQRPAREVEIAERLGLSVEAYRRLLTDTACRHMFTFEEAPDAADVESDYTPPDTAAEEGQTTSTLEAAIAALPERERFIIEQTFFGDATLREVGARLGVNESRACQLRSQAVARLRAKLR